MNESKATKVKVCKDCGHDVEMHYDMGCCAQKRGEPIGTWCGCIAAWRTEPELLRNA